MQPDINKMKVAQLKELATQFNIALPEKILKKELLELIQGHVESNFAQADENPKADIETENPIPEKKRRGRPPKKKPVEIPVEKPVANVVQASENIAKKIEPVTKPQPQAKVEEVAEKAKEATNKKPTEEQSTSESPDRVGGYKKNLNRKKTFYKKSEDKEKAAAENQATIAGMVKSGECGKAEGLLDIQADGYGFLRALDPAQKDVYISIAQIRRFHLREGDHVMGATRPEKENERYLAMLFIEEINGESPDSAKTRKHFDDLVPIYPTERIDMELVSKPNDLSIRMIDLIAPVGKGQRGMIVSPPKAGKTTLLKNIANSISENYPDLKLFVLLIDERPEEVTDMQRSTKAEVIYSTFDERPENHCKIAEMLLKRVKRMVERGEEVVVLMDSITRLSRAYNLTVSPSGRSLSGGLDPGALYKPKRFFGAARNIENGGSLTILATALIDTGSRMDDIIYEEFKGTGNMELHLDRKLQERRIFPAVDMYRSGTRKEEILMSEDEMEIIWQLRKLLSGNQEAATEQIISLMNKTANNAEFLAKMKNWIMLTEKGGFRQRKNK